MTDTAKILDKIKKLHLKAESCRDIGSDAEAQAFAEAVSRMLNDHRLSMSDLQFETERKSEPVDKHIVEWEAHGLKTRAVRTKWIERLAAIVARAYTCDILVFLGSSRVVLVGTLTNRQVAEYTLVTLVRAAEKIAEAEYVKYYYKCRDEGDVTMARGFKVAFLDGFVARIAVRFAEEKARMEQQSSTALVRFDKSAADVRDFMAGHGGGKASQLTRSSHNGAGYKAGAEKAESMDIRGRAVNETAGRREQLG